MSAVGHSLPTFSAPVPTIVRYYPIATVSGLRPNGREVPIETGAPQRTASLFDHLVGACEQRLRHGEAERPGGLEVEKENMSAEI